MTEPAEDSSADANRHSTPLRHHLSRECPRISTTRVTSGRWESRWAPRHTLRPPPLSWATAVIICPRGIMRDNSSTWVRPQSPPSPRPSSAQSHHRHKGRSRIFWSALDRTRWLLPLPQVTGSMAPWDKQEAMKRDSAVPRWCQAHPPTDNGADASRQTRWPSVTDDSSSTRSTRTSWPTMSNWDPCSCPWRRRMWRIRSRCDCSCDYNAERCTSWSLCPTCNRIRHRWKWRAF